jgi:RimJ/RimL family protein N-acetyltransferase
MNIPYNASGQVELTGNRVIVVREPEVARDLERMVKFFSDLPPKVRNHLRYQVTQVAPLRARLEQLDGENHWRLIAEQGGQIVGDATMDREPYGWTRHVANLRWVVAPGSQNEGVGPVLCSQLVAIGAAAGIELLYSEVMVSQVEQIRALEDAGFVQEAIRRGFAKGLDGRRSDLVVMANDLEGIWRHLGDLLVEMDARPLFRA